MISRSWSGLCAIVLTAVLAYGYAGPVVCASAHGHDAAATGGQHAHHGVHVPAGANALSSGADHAGGCPDMEHCGLTLLGPVATGTPPMLVAPSATTRTLPAPTAWIGFPESPATPPPRA